MKLFAGRQATAEDLARAALLCLCIALLGSKQYWINYLDPSWWRFVARVENYNFRFPNLPDAAGMLIALCTVRSSRST